MTMKQAGHTQQYIAIILGRSPSTISRELARNQGLLGYHPVQAQRFTQERRSQARKSRNMTSTVRGWIERLIRQQLSPQQVIDYLARHMKLSLHHETVYQLIYEDKANGGSLYQPLRIASKPYRKRYGQYDQRGMIKIELIFILRIPMLPGGAVPKKTRMT